MTIKSNTKGPKKLSNNLKELGNKKSITLSELMPKDFISKYSQYENVDKLFELSGFNLAVQSDFAAVPKDKMDDFISNNTLFTSWEEMQKKAVYEFTHKQLFMDTYELVKDATSLAKSKKYDEAISLLNELRVTNHISCSDKIIPYYQKAGRYSELERYCIEVLIPMDSHDAQDRFSHKCKELQHAFISLSVYKIYKKLVLCAKREKLKSDELRFSAEASSYYQLYETNLAAGDKVELDIEFIEAKDIWGIDYAEWPESYKNRFSDYISNI